MGPELVLGRDSVEWGWGWGDEAWRAGRELLRARLVYPAARSGELLCDCSFGDREGEVEEPPESLLEPMLRREEMRRADLTGADSMVGAEATRIMCDAVPAMHRKVPWVAAEKDSRSEIPSGSRIWQDEFQQLDGICYDLRSCQGNGSAAWLQKEGRGAEQDV